MMDETPSQFDSHNRLLSKMERPKLWPIVNMFPKVNRNDACPCGSGKKFKKCCLLRSKAGCDGEGI
jgi:uncharacterized protein YecA (UPF0149 family)